MYMVTHYSDMNASHTLTEERRRCMSVTIQNYGAYDLTALNACNFTSQHFEIINHCLVSNAHINYACWLRCTYFAIALQISLQNIFLAAIIDCSQLFHHTHHRQFAEATF